MAIISWLRKFPWLSLGLVLLTYWVFGWYIGSYSLNWSHWLVEQGQNWGWALKEDSLYLGINLLAVLSIAMISLALTAPITILTIFLGSWLKADFKAILSMLAWSFAFVLMLRWFEYFTNFLILLSAAILGRLELQRAGYNEWQILLLLTGLCILSFGSGILTYFWYHPQ